MNSSAQSRIAKLKCQVCAKPSALMCAKCKTAVYCSREHQQQHWADHKSRCKGESTSINLSNKINKREATEDRMRMRKDMMKAMLDFQFEKSMACNASVQELSQQMLKYYRSPENLCELAADVFFLVQLKLSLGAKDQARKILLKFLEQYADQIFPKDGEGQAQRQTFKEQSWFFSRLPATKIMQSDEHLTNFRKISELYSVASKLAIKLEEYGLAEQCYFCTMLVIDKCFGKLSMEYSNCQFMLGSFYVRLRQLEKARALFKDCLSTRRSELRGEQKNNIYVMDCLLNLGLIELSNGSTKCVQLFERYLALNYENNLGISPLVAQIQEYLGYEHLKTNSFARSLHSFEQCFEIRSKLAPELLERAEDNIIEFYERLTLFIQQNLREDNKLEDLVDMHKKLEGNQMYRKFKDKLRESKAKSVFNEEKSDISDISDFIINESLELVVNETFFSSLSAKERQEVCMLQRKLDNEKLKENKFNEIRNYLMKIESKTEIFNLLRFSNERLFSELKL